MQSSSDPTGLDAPPALLSDPVSGPTTTGRRATDVRRPRSGRLVALAAATAIVAAACGSGTSTTDAAQTVEQAAADQAESEESGDSPDAAGSADDTGAADDDNAAVEDGSDDADQPESEGPTIPESHLFPDLATTNIIDGSTINLANQLAGGDTPVLLWFFAPH